ncbi:MAG: hypothetical protein IJQ39_14820 [Thermoguttaceae bacterium]|nr:hypothetical protein [Thermoguttaceae bacterium]
MVDFIGCITLIGVMCLIWLAFFDDFLVPLSVSGLFYLFIWIFLFYFGFHSDFTTHKDWLEPNDTQEDNVEFDKYTMIKPWRMPIWIRYLIRILHIIVEKLAFATALLLFILLCERSFFLGVQIAVKTALENFFFTMSFK